MLSGMLNLPQPHGVVGCAPAAARVPRLGGPVSITPWSQATIRGTERDLLQRDFEEVWSSHFPKYVSAGAGRAVGRCRRPRALRGTWGRGGWLLCCDRRQAIS